MSHIGKYTFKVNNIDTRATSKNIFLVLPSLALNRSLSTGKVCEVHGIHGIHGIYSSLVPVKEMYFRSYFFMVLCNTLEKITVNFFYEYFGTNHFLCQFYGFHVFLKGSLKAMTRWKFSVGVIFTDDKQEIDHKLLWYYDIILLCCDIRYTRLNHPVTLIFGKNLIASLFITKMTNNWLKTTDQFLFYISLVKYSKKLFSIEFITFC